MLVNEDYKINFSKMYITEHEMKCHLENNYWYSIFPEKPYGMLVKTSFIKEILEYENWYLEGVDKILQIVKHGILINNLRDATNKFIYNLLTIMEYYRINKLWNKSDVIRKFLVSHGFVIKNNKNHFKLVEWELPRCFYSTVISKANYY